jgi:hypothetical protein
MFFFADAMVCPWPKTSAQRAHDQEQYGSGAQRCFSGDHGTYFSMGFKPSKIVV